MSKPVIKIENLSKVYRLGEVGTGTLAHDLNRFWQMNVLGKEDPYAKIGQVNDRTQRAQKGEHISALRDINLEVQQGEVLGIIGKNGAGKSTLLKILSRVTSPTTGSIKVKGRLASLLEVGTGFHPEMTGRENIYMNGTIMGMRRWEIDRKLDEIVEFAGVAKYLDTPTKRYSSGMTVRLGFAIAAHLEPEILVVDEVLAVGDAEFQKKAIGKMQDVSTNDGRTVLFVSHNMASVKTLCTRGVILKDGYTYSSGFIDDMVSQYLSMDEKETTKTLKDRKVREGNQNACFSNIQMKVDGNESERLIPTGAKVAFEIEIEAKREIPKPSIFLSIYNNESIQLIHSNTNITLNKGFSLKKGINKIRCEFEYIPLQIGSYFLNLAMNEGEIRLDRIERALELELIENNIYETGKLQGRHQGVVILPNSWELCSL